MKVENTSQHKRALKIHEAAQYACVSRSTVQNWIDRRLLPCESLPGRGGKYHFRRIRKTDLDEFLNSNYRHAHAEQSKRSSMKSGNGSIFLLPK